MSNNERVILIDDDDDPVLLDYDDNLSHYDSEFDSDSYNSSSFSGSDDELNVSTYLDVFDSVRIGPCVTGKNDIASSSSMTVVEEFSDESGSDSDVYSSVVHELKVLRLKKVDVESFLNGCWVFDRSDPESSDNKSNVDFGTADDIRDVSEGASKKGKNRRPSYFLRRRRWVVLRLLLLFVAAITISITIVLLTTQPHLFDNTGKNSVGDDQHQDQLLSSNIASSPTDGSVGGSPSSQYDIDLEDMPVTNEAEAWSVSDPSKNSGATNHVHRPHPHPYQNDIFEVHDLSLGGQNDPITVPSAADDLEESQLVVETTTTQSGLHYGS